MILLNTKSNLISSNIDDSTGTFVFLIKVLQVNNSLLSNNSFIQDNSNISSLFLELKMQTSMSLSLEEYLL